MSIRISAPRRKETEVQRAILDYLKLIDIMAWRQKAQAVFDGKKWRANSGTPGLSDIGGILPGGRALLIEVKSPRGRLRPDQREFLEEAARRGAVAIMCQSVEDVQLALKARGY